MRRQPGEGHGAVRGLGLCFGSVFLHCSCKNPLKNAETWNKKCMISHDSVGWLGSMLSWLGLPIGLHPASGGLGWKSQESLSHTLRCGFSLPHGVSSPRALMAA